MLADDALEGRETGSAGLWLTDRYHAPSDDAAQPVDLATAALYEEIVRRILVDVANADARPAWKPDSFLRRFKD